MAATAPATPAQSAGAVPALPQQQADHVGILAAEVYFPNTMVRPWAWATRLPAQTGRRAALAPPLTVCGAGTASMSDSGAALAAGGGGGR